MAIAPKILLATHHDWYSPIQVGVHHLARRFAADGWHVAFISEPITPLHLAAARRSRLADRFALYRRGGRRDVAGRVWTYVPGAVSSVQNAPLLRGRWIGENWHRLTLPNVVRKVAVAGFDRLDVLAIESINQTFWLDALPYEKSLYRMSDDIGGFAKTTDASRQREQELISRVDLVTCTARKLVNVARAGGARNAIHLPNGVDSSHFIEESGPAPVEYARIRRPIAVYAGSLETWFDFDLLAAAAEQLRDVSFVLIGPAHVARKRLAAHRNVHLLGPRAYCQLPRYLRYADVGIIPFDTRRHRRLVDSIHPLKLYEYMACGLPVVATRWAELEAMESPAVLCDDADQFVQALRRAVASRPDRQRLIRYAQAADWSNRFAQLKRALGL